METEIHIQKNRIIAGENCSRNTDRKIADETKTKIRHR